MHPHSTLPRLALETEEWRPAVGWEGWYEVSNLGRVRRIRAAPGARTGYVLHPYIRPPGYHSVQFCRHGNSSQQALHRLVAKAFLGPCPRGHEANHKDTDKLNNRATNLEWVTPQGNMRHAWQHGVAKPPPVLRGETNPNTKLTEEAVREIRRLRGKVTQQVLADLYHVSWQHIGDIQRGEARRNVR